MVEILIPLLLGMLDQDVNLRQLEIYAKNFEPRYYDGTTKLVVAKIPTPPDSLNEFIYYCIENNVREVDKYAFLVVLKLQEEFIRVNDSDYDFCSYYNNGIVDLVISRVGRDRDTIGCAFTRTYDIYKWLLAHEEIYSDYDPLIEQIEKIGILLKDRR